MSHSRDPTSRGVCATDVAIRSTLAASTALVAISLKSSWTMAFSITSMASRTACCRCFRRWRAFELRRWCGAASTTASSPGSTLGTRVVTPRRKLGLSQDCARLRLLQKARPAVLESARREACELAIKIWAEISSLFSTMLWTSKGRCANAHSILSMLPRRRAAASGPPRAGYDRFWPDLVHPAH